MILRLGILVFVVACGGSSARTPMTPPDDRPPATSSPAAPTMSNDAAVFEAVLLHEIAASPPVGDEGVCLALRGATAEIETAVLAAIKRKYPTTVPNSECAGGGPTGPVTLSATGGKAVRFDVGPITWVTETSAKIDGGGGHRGGGAREVHYIVEKTPDGWKVTSEKPGIMT